MTTAKQQVVSPTYNDIIETHLLSGRPITSWQAITEYRITCLAQRIHDLRSVGLPIQSILIQENGKRFSRYWIDKEDRARYMSGQVNVPADVHGTGSATTNQDDGILASINEVTKGHRAKHDALAAVNADDGVWLPHDYIDNLLSALTNNAKSLNLLAQITDIEGGAEADKINDYSMDVSDIAMSLTTATSSARPHPNSPCISGTWLSHEYLKKLKLSIDGNANGLGTMVIVAKLADTDLHDGVSEASMRLTEISDNLQELMALTETIAIVKELITND